MSGVLKQGEKEALTELMIAVPPFGVKEKKEGISWLLIKIFFSLGPYFLVLLMFHCQP